MNPILIAVLVVCAIGLICGVMLVVVSKLMAVKVDEKLAAIRECLPGANCGACGYAGCDGYAEALAGGGDVKTNLCVPGADAVALQLSQLLGVEFEDVVEQVAVIRCLGDYSVTHDKMDYRGINSCAAANLMFAGRSACPFGCLALGDCARACPNGAICVENGVARVNTRKCTGCGICAKTCPNHLITVMPDTARVLVTCSNHEKGAATRKECTHGCLGCGKCMRECPAEAIKVENNLAQIDYDKCTGCGHCAQVCPTGAVMLADFSGIHRQGEKKA